MTSTIVSNQYQFSLKKRGFDLLLSVTGLIITLPVFLAISAAIKFTSDGPVFFTQRRIGKSGKIFKIMMFRTMYPYAERDQNKYDHLNEANWPVCKIKDDPRFVGIGKTIARSGLDELAQLINVIKGDMSLVGPRPLPINEAKKLTNDQRIRELVKPGMTSSWVSEGAHNLSFAKWMKLDRIYVENASLAIDITILTKTILLVLKLVFSGN